MAGRIPERIKQEIVERTDMVAIVGEIVQLRRAGTTLKGLCPFHDEKTPSFTVNAASKVYYCHGCQAGGDAISFVRETRGLSFVEALEYLGERAGIEIVREHMSPADEAREKAERSQRGRLLALNAAAQSFFEACFRGRAGGRARAYVEARGLTPETCRNFGLGMAPDSRDDLVRHLRRNHFADEDIVTVGLGMTPRSGGDLMDRFRDRLMFPVYQRQGDLVAFGGRQLGDERQVAKYMNSPEAELSELDVRYNSALWKFYKKSNCVFGLPQARQGIRKRGMAVIVEGNLDVMMLHQVGEDAAVCPMGTALTDGQLREIRRFTDRLALVFDGDKAGRAAAMKSVPLCIAEGFDGVYVVLPDGEDPDSFVRNRGLQAWLDLVAGADDLITGYINALLGTWDGTIGGKAKILGQVGPVLASIHDPIARDMARDYLGTRLLGTRIEDNRVSMDRYIRQTARAPARSVPAAQPLREPVPQYDEVELDLVRVVLWYPSLLPEVERVGGLDYMQHLDLAEALRDLGRNLCDLARPATTDLLAQVQSLAESPVRSVMMRILVQDPTVAVDQALPSVEQILNRLEIKALRRRLAQVIHVPPNESEDETLQRCSLGLRIRQRIEELETSDIPVRQADRDMRATED